MNIEEYKKIIEQTPEMRESIEFRADIAAIVGILLARNICTEEEFKKTKEKAYDKIINKNFESEKSEDFETIKTINDFMNMFNIKGE